MPKPEREIVVLMADDDPDDQMLVQDALKTLGMECDLRFVVDGRDLMDYLRRQGRYADPKDAPSPDLILLDLNMPHMSGYEALDLIRSDFDLNLIPIIVLSTTRGESEIVRAYSLGANAFVPKPSDFEQLINAMDSIRRFWFQVSELPPKEA